MIMATGNNVYTYLSTHNNVPKYVQYVLPTIFACMVLMCSPYAHGVDTYIFICTVSYAHYMWLLVWRT